MAVPGIRNQRDLWVEGNPEVQPAVTSNPSSPSKKKITDFSEREMKQLRKLIETGRMMLYKRDLAEWFADLFQRDVTDKSFINDLETGVLLCQLAKMIEDGEMAGFRTKAIASKNRAGRTYIPAPKNYTKQAKPGSFHARDNIAQFINWAKHLGVDHSVLFEADDIVEQKNEKHVLYCLMELARVQGGVEPPKLIQMEQDMKAGRMKMSPTNQADIIAAIRRVLQKLMLDEDTPISTDAKGRYIIGDFSPLQLHQLRDQVLAWDGNTWDQLENVLLNEMQKQHKNPSSNGGAATAVPVAKNLNTEPEVPMRRATVADPNSVSKRGLVRRQSMSFDNPGPDHADCEARIAALLRQIEDLKKQLDATRRDKLDELEDLRKQVRAHRNCERDKEELKDQLKSAERFVAAQGDRPAVSDLERKLAAAEQELQDAQRDFVDQRVADAGENAVQMRQMEEEYKRQLAERDDQIAALQRADVGSRQLEAEKVALLQYREQAEAAIVDLHKKLDEAEDRADQAEENLEIVKKEDTDALGTAMDKMRNLEAQIRQLEADLVDANTDNDKLREEVRRALAEKDTVGGDADGLRRQVDALQRDLDDSTTMKDRLNEKLKQALEDANSTGQQAGTLGERVSQLQQQLNDNGKENQDLKSRIRKLTAELEDEHQQSTRLNDKLKRALDEIDATGEENSALGTQVSQLQRNLEDAELAKRALEQRFAKAMEEVEATSKDAGATSAQLAKERAKQLKLEQLLQEEVDKVHKLQDQVDAADERADAAEDDAKKQLKDRVRAMEDVTAEKLAALEKEIRKLKADAAEQAARYDAEKAQLVRKLKEASERGDSAAKNNEDAAAQLAEVMALLDAVERSIPGYEHIRGKGAPARMEDLKEQLRKNTEEAIATRDRVDQLGRDLRAALSDKAEMETKIARLEQELALANADLAKARQDGDHLRGREASERDQMQSRLQAEMDARAADKAKSLEIQEQLTAAAAVKQKQFNEELEQLKKRYDADAEARIQAMKDRLLDSEGSKHGKLQAELDELTGKLAEEKRRSEELEKRLRDLQDEFGEKEVDFKRKLREATADADAEAAKSAAALQSKIQELELKLEAANTRLATQQANEDDLRAKLEQANAQRLEAEEENTRNKLTLDTANRRLKDFDVVNDRLQKASQDDIAKDRQIAELEGKLDQLTRKRQQSEDDATSFQSILEATKGSTKAQIEALQGEIQRLRDQLTRADEDLAAQRIELNKRIAALEDKLREATDAKNAEKEKRLSEQERWMQENEARALKNERELADFKKQLEADANARIAASESRKLALLDDEASQRAREQTLKDLIRLKARAEEAKRGNRAEQLADKLKRDLAHAELTQFDPSTTVNDIDRQVDKVDTLCRQATAKASSGESPLPDAKHLSSIDKEDLALRDDAVLASLLKQIEAAGHIDDLRRALQAAQRNHDSAKTGVLEGQLRTSEAELKAIDDQLNSAIRLAQKKEQQKAIDTAQHEVAALNNIAERLKNKRRILESSSGETSAQVAELRRQLDDAHEKNKEDHKKCQTEKAALQSKIDDLERINDDLRQQIAELLQQLQSQEKEKADQLKHLSELEQQAIKDREDKERQLAALKEQQQQRSAAAPDNFLQYRKEIAAWFNSMLGTRLHEASLMEDLSDGVHMCELANAMNDAEEEIREEEAEAAATGKPSPEEPGLDSDTQQMLRERDISPVEFDRAAQPDTPGARQNTKNFIAWSRRLGLVDPDIFTPADVETKQQKEVLFGLYDVARNGRHIPLPDIVEQERNQVVVAAKAARLKKKNKYRAVKGDDVDRAVSKVINDMGASSLLTRIGPGRYTLGDDPRILMIRVLRSVVMIRVGGGWENLKTYLQSHPKVKGLLREVGSYEEALRTDHNLAVEDQRVEEERMLKGFTPRSRKHIIRTVHVT